MKKKRILSEETKRKIGDANRGKKKIFSPEAIENIRKAAAKRRGIKTGPCSDEKREKIRQATLGKKKNFKNPHANWFQKGQKPEYGFKKGLVPWNTGIRKSEKRSSTKYNDWTKIIRERDGNQCKKCGSTNRLDVHHIIPWKVNKELRYDDNNAITLCRKCHGKEDIEQKMQNRTYKFSKPRKIPWYKLEGKDHPLKGKPSTRKEYKHSEETKLKMRAAKAKRKAKVED